MKMKADNMKINRGSILKYLMTAICMLLIVFACVSVIKTEAFAQDLDNILNYEVTVNVNEDATLDMVYHLDWMVLDSDAEGPLSWITIGIPNKHYVSYTALSDTIKNIQYTSSDGPSLRIDFDREYFAGEVVSFDFELVQDNVYEVNRLTDGETVYDFTPGWFDNIFIDNLTIRWNNDKMESWSPSCEIEDGYCVWKTFLDKGQKYPIQVVYKNDAYAFDTSKNLNVSVSASSSGKTKGRSIISVLAAAFSTLIYTTFSGSFIAVPVILSIILRRRYNRSANFGSEPKITRTRIEYYPNCPGCNAPRPEGKDNCSYCGCSFIKSETKIEEKDIPPEEKELLNRKVNGTYRYSSSPNTYMRVHVIPVPVSRPSRSYSSSSSSSRSSSSRSSHHSSCAHSSCACACACACAGGGRAGCSTKDFYNTNLKLKYFEKKKKAKDRL